MGINNSALLGGVGPAKVPERTREVPLAMDELSAEINRLHSLVGSLAARISPLLSPEHQVSGSEQKMAASCEFAATIYSNADDISRVNRSLADMLNVLEI